MNESISKEDSLVTQPLPLVPVLRYTFASLNGDLTEIAGRSPPRRDRSGGPGDWMQVWSSTFILSSEVK